MAAVVLGRVRGLIGAVVLAAALLGGSAGAASAAGASVTCRLYAGIPTALSPGGSSDYVIDGELCASPSELKNGETVQLLIHGATYNHTYWDFGTIDGTSYSYARDVAAAGFPTFAIDEVGAGHSSHPPSASVTIQAAAYVAHQAVEDLRSGVVGGIAFGKVIVVGHSLGSGTAWVEAATYDDVAGAIVTGLVHSYTAFNQDVAQPDLYPAVDDPKFVDSGLDSGYYTTRPGTRATLFYSSPDSDPKVIAADEARKDVLPLTDLASVFPLLTSTYTRQINTPVLDIQGSADALLCGAEANGGSYDCSSAAVIAHEEAPYYSAAADLRVCLIPNSGHDINLALNYALEEADAVQWSYEYVGQQGTPTVPAHTSGGECASP